MLNRNVLSTNATSTLCYVLRLCFVLSPTDAQQVLQHGSHTLDDNALPVTEVKAEEAAHLMEHKEMPPFSVGNVTSVRVVQIRGFPPHKPKMIVEMFIETVSESKLESCSYDEQNGVAVVTFPNTEGKYLITFWCKFCLDNI